jgi:hypothetical protein
MRQRICLGAMVAAVMIAPAAMALDPLGPPAASIGAGQWDVGVDYIYSSQNLDFKNGEDNGSPASPEERSGTIKHVKLQKGFATFGYGLTNELDVYGRIGAAQIRTDLPENFMWYEQGFSSSTMPAYGAGTRVTFYDDGLLKLGALGQVTWTDNLSDESTIDLTTQKTTFNIVEGEVAVGPAYKLTDAVTVYGGPFFYWLSGNVNVNDTFLIEGLTPGRATADLEQPTWFGGYIGAQAALSWNVSANIEYQHTAFADAVGANVKIKF